MSKAEIDAAMLDGYGAALIDIMHDVSGWSVWVYENDKTQQRFLVDVDPDGKATVYVFHKNLN